MAREPTDRAEDLPEVAVITLRGGPTPQNATYLLLNVLSTLTTVSLVTVTLSEESKIHDEYNVTEISRGSKESGLFRTALLFLKNQYRICVAIWRLDADVLYFFGGVAYTVPIVFGRIVGKKVVVQPRGDVPLTLQLEWEENHSEVVARWLANLVRGLEFVSYSVAHRIVTYTESMATELGLDKFNDKLYTDGCRYIDVSEFRPLTPDEGRSNRVGMVGRLDVEKGIEQVTKAIDHLPEEVEFLFVGDGDRREWVENRLAEDIQAGRVEITGWVGHDEVPGYLNRMDLLVLASEPTEGLPTAIQEAFACGTPVYAPPVSGIPDVVMDGETGFLLRDRNPKRIAADIERILVRADLPAISGRCREFAVDNYSFDASVTRFRQLLLDL